MRQAAQQTGSARAVPPISAGPAVAAPRQAGIGNQARLRGIQAKLTVGAVNDPLEHEADQAAEQVMRMPATPPRISRKCAECEEEDRLRKKSAAPEGGEFGAPASVDRVFAQPGRALEPASRQFFDPRFGADFSGIRIHDDAEAARSAQEIGARAYASGNHVVFGAGEYAPHSQQGQKLLAHELAHTMQQGAAAVRRDAAMALDPVQVATQLRDAMAGFFTDEDRIYAALSGRTQAQLDQISTAYKTLTTRELSDDLTKKLSKSELAKLGTLAPNAGPDDPAKRATGTAVQIHDAIHRLITDKSSIFTALQGRAPDEITALKAAYNSMYKKDLIDDIKGALSGDDLNKALGELGIAPSVYVQNTELGGVSVGNFDFHFKDCVATAWVWVKFKFAGNITAVQQGRFKTRFIAAIDAVWGNSGYKLTGGGACPCSDVPIKVHVEENPGSFAHKVVDVQMPAPPATPSTSKAYDQDVANRPHVISDVNVNFCTSDRTLAHEFGHVLGLYDEYDGGFWENIMFWHKNQNDPTALMNKGTELRPRYFQHYRDEVQKTAPDGCNYGVTAPPPTAPNPAPALDVDCR